MTETGLPYGDSAFMPDYARLNVLDVVKRNLLKLAAKSSQEVVRDAIAHPIDSPTLDKLVRKGDRICLIVPDITRVWESPAVSTPIMIGALNRCGVADADIVILCATGTHRRMTAQEHEKLLGRDIASRFKIIDHQAADRDDMREVGRTSRGTPVWLNRHAVEADKVITICGAAYHFLAGFGGGGKMLLPGIAADGSIQANHKLALLPGFGEGRNPEVRSGNYSDSNPFHADIFEAAGFLPPVFSLNVVTDDAANIIAAFAGNWRAAHARACRLVAEMEGVTVPERAKLVIASAGGAPRDINLYQGIKTVVNAVEAALPGACLIVLLKCPEGFGNEDARRLLCDCKNMHEREQSLRDRFSIGAFVGYYLAECAEKYNLILVTDIDQALFANTAIRAVKTLDEAMTLAGENLAEPCIVMPHGASTFPMPQK